MFNHSSTVRLPVLVAAALLISAGSAFAQTQSLPPAPTLAPQSSRTGALSAPSLVSQAFRLAQEVPGARPAAVRGAAAFLPRLDTSSRAALTAQWLTLGRSVSPEARADAFNSFFDVAARVDPVFAERIARQTPDAAARSGGLLQISRAYSQTNWLKADALLDDAQRAAREETNPLRRARALVFCAYRASELDPAKREAAVREASTQVNALRASGQRDALLVELAGATASFDLPQARSQTARITDPKLKTLADARVGLAEISQTSLTKSTSDRVQALATAAAPYDARALPVLLQLPAQPDVLKAISQTLPPIYPTAQPAIAESQLETLWDYAGKAPTGVYRDQLQSRLARLMVLEDVWRGRDWGKQLGWKGGRVQVGAFVNSVLQARRSQLGVASLQDTAQKNVGQAYAQAQKLQPAARVEALLLLAGQLIG